MNGCLSTERWRGKLIFPSDVSGLSSYDFWMHPSSSIIQTRFSSFQPYPPQQASNCQAFSWTVCRGVEPRCCKYSYLINRPSFVNSLTLGGDQNVISALDSAVIDTARVPPVTFHCFVSPFLSFEFSGSSFLRRHICTNYH